MINGWKSMGMAVKENIKRNSSRGGLGLGLDMEETTTTELETKGLEEAERGEVTPSTTGEKPEEEATQEESKQPIEIESVEQELSQHTNRELSDHIRPQSSKDEGVPVPVSLRLSESYIHQKQTEDSQRFYKFLIAFIICGVIGAIIGSVVTSLKAHDETLRVL